MPVIHIIHQEPCIPNSSSERKEAPAAEMHWRTSQVKVEEFAHQSETCSLHRQSRYPDKN
jgi:hypothetical protein